MTGFTTVTKNVIKDRDGGQCVRCGTTVLIWNGTTWQALARYEHHHRRPRAMGGSSDPVTNAPVNGLLLCADCHAHVESNRAEAYDDGYLVHQGIDPGAIPVLHHQHGLTYLTNEGYTPSPVKETTP
ncbi:hypothetical protein [Phycicoccus sp. 3266]|uniref:HNH endonuclease n=1 Tax=Phycicoccus sp. 3266 TaxID=2817751 RepID=UPI0028646113|nr:hypothetical protein [Phycicoccus sp. 3266]MDR6861943.1 5-methylcytosine-specific restriction protein A [Phycicoccus sp. 3266]